VRMVLEHRATLAKVLELGQRFDLLPLRS